MPKILPNPIGRDRASIVQVPYLDDYIDAGSIELVFTALLKRLEDIEYRLNAVSTAINNYNPQQPPSQDLMNILQITGKPVSASNSTIIYNKDPYTLVPFKAPTSEDVLLTVSVNKPASEMSYTWDLQGVGILNTTDPFITTRIVGNRQRISVTAKQTFSNGTSTTTSIDFYLEASGRALLFGNTTNLPQLYGKNLEYNVYLLQGYNTWVKQGVYSAVLSPVGSVTYTSVPLPSNADPLTTYKYRVFVKLVEGYTNRQFMAEEIYYDPDLIDMGIVNAETKLYANIDVTPSGIQGSNVILLQFVNVYDPAQTQDVYSPTS